VTDSLRPPKPGGRPALAVRGESRVGEGDLGANTRRVLDLYGALEQVGAKGARASESWRPESEVRRQILQAATRQVCAVPARIRVGIDDA
jgi:hypothetical protein